jgi:hypothetical protein
MSMKLYDTLIESVNEMSPPLKGTYSCVLIGGLDTRPGDKPLSWQVEQLRTATGYDNIKGFRFTVDGTTLKGFFNENPNIPVFMFSKGCEKVNEVLKCNVDKSKIYVIEPWCGSSNSMNFFNNVASKIPSNHIFVGGNSSRGGGINGATSSKSKSHWGAIASVGQTVGKTTTKPHGGAILSSAREVGRMFNSNPIQSVSPKIVGGKITEDINEQIIGKVMDKIKSFFGADTSKNPADKPFSVENLKAEIIKQKIKYPNIALAQAVLESGHFGSAIFLDNNNLFGMKKPSVRKTLATGENRGHATFKNWVDSVIDYKLFQDQNGYSSLSVKDYMKKLGKDYCPGCDYENKIKEQMAYNKKKGIFI